MVITQYTLGYKDRKSEYIKTNLMAFHKDIKKGKIKDPYIIVEGANRIKNFMQILNQKNTENWSVKEIAEYLEADGEDISFTDFANKYIAKLVNADRYQTSKGYKASLKSLQKHLGNDNIMFRQLTHSSILGFIESLMHTASAKATYPVCIKTMFNAACDEYNDYDRDIIKIKTQPFRKIKIPRNDTPKQQALSTDIVRKFFSCELPDTKMALPLQELGRDVCFISFCLAGINTVDLFKMEKSCLRED